MVRHEDVGVDRASCALAHATEQVCVVRSVLVAREARRAVVAALNEMERLSRANDSERSWHAASMSSCWGERRIKSLRPTALPDGRWIAYVTDE